MDLLSTILGELKVSSTLYCVASLTSPWGFHFRYERGAMFYAVVEGECLFVASDGEARHLCAGDYVVMPRSVEHKFLDQRGSQAIALDEIMSRASNLPAGTLEFGGGGPRTKLIGGCLWLEGPHLDLLLSALPDHIILKASAANDSSFGLLLQILQKEVAGMRFGTAMFISRISDAIFIEAIRGYIQQGSGGHGNWLRALQDEVVGTTLTLMHGDLSYPWTLDELSARTHVSRSGLAARFQLLVGQAPHQYLIERRLERAKHLMASSTQSISEIALDVGYDSGQALAKAFKNRLGVTPKQFRASTVGQ